MTNTATPLTGSDATGTSAAHGKIDPSDLQNKGVEVLDRWPSAGVTVAVVRNAVAGVTDVLADRPIRGSLQAHLAVARVGGAATGADARVAAGWDESQERALHRHGRLLRARYSITEGFMV